jgi:tRNA-5-taurinomethyluridine 2-sulfurtransferase
MLRVVASALCPLIRRPPLLIPKPLLRIRPPPQPFRALSSSAPPAAAPSAGAACDVVTMDEEHLKRCTAADRAPLGVAVLVSGGVDSSVALRLLHAAGHRCTAFYLKIWFQVCTAGCLWRPFKLLWNVTLQSVT